MQEKELKEMLEKQAASDLYNNAMEAINNTIQKAEGFVCAVPPLLTIESWDTF